MKKKVISLLICILMIAVHIPNVFAAEVTPNTLRQDNAVKYFLLGRISYDYTGDINFYLTDGDGNVIYTSSNRPFITHLEQWDVPSASY